MKHKKTFAISIFMSVFLVGMAKGFYKAYKKSEEASKNIITLLKDNCDCEEITQSMFSKGIQFSKKEGFSNVKASYILTDCDFKNINEEANRIDRLLQNNICGIKDFDYITLDFVNNEVSKTVTLTNNKNEN